MRTIVAAITISALAGTGADAMTDDEIARQIQRAMERGGAAAVQDSTGGVRTTVAERFQPEVMRQSEFVVYRFTGELGLQQIYGVSAAANGVWLATSAGLVRYEPDSDLWTLVRPPAESGAQGVVAVSATGRHVGVGFWAYPQPGHAQPKGAYWYRPWTGGWQRIVRGDFLAPMHWDGTNLWLGSSRELLQVRPDDGYLKRLDVEENPYLADGEVRRMTAWNGEVWLASRSKLDREEKVWRGGGVSWRRGPFDRWRHYTTEDGLAHDYCAAIAVDGSEAWVAHWEEERGLSRYDRASRRWEKIPASAEGLDVGGVELAIDHGILWIGQQGGLVKLDRRTLAATRYTEQDGLPGYIVSGISVGEKDVWVSVYAYGGEGHNGVRSAGVWVWRRVLTQRTQRRGEIWSVYITVRAYAIGASVAFRRYRFAVLNTLVLSSCI
jgi:hypothetical protein